MCIMHPQFFALSSGRFFLENTNWIKEIFGIFQKSEVRIEFFLSLRCNYYETINRRKLCQSSICNLSFSVQEHCFAKQKKKLHTSNKSNFKRFPFISVDEIKTFIAHESSNSIHTYNSYTSFCLIKCDVFLLLF